MADITLGAINLGDSVQWTDQFTGWKRGQDVQTAVHGSLIVQEAARQSGRPITLQSRSSGDRHWGVQTLTTIRAIQALIDAGGTLTLVIPAHDEADREFSVRFDQSNPIECAPLKDTFPPQPDEFWSLTLRLFTV